MIPVVALAAFFAVSSIAAVAMAASPAITSVPEVSLDVERCPSLPRHEVVRLAALELDAPVLAVSAAGEHTTRVEVACSGNSVQLRVSDPLTGKQLMRSMNLSARQEMVAARLVALAVSELVITSWMELTLTHGSSEAATTSNPTNTAPSLELRRAAEERAERRVQRRSAAAGQGPDVGYVLALAQATGPFTGVGIGWGGGLRLGWISGRGWPNRAESLEGARAARETRQASGTSAESTEGGQEDERLAIHPAADLDLSAAWAEVTSGSGSVGVSTWSVGPRAGVKLRRGRLWLDLGLGGRVGLARVVGAPLDLASTRGGTSIGTWWGPAGHAGLGMQWGHFVVAAGVEAGRVLRYVAGEVDGANSVSVAGNWVAGTLALGWGR